MGFDIKKFQKQEFTSRTIKVEVKDLKLFFKDGDDPVWEVRGLSADEIYKSKEIAGRAEVVQGIIEGLAGSKIEIAEAIKELTGQGTDVSAQTSVALQQLVFGSVNPQISLENAVKLAETFPVEFIQLTTKILELTGLGKVAVKPVPCGKK